MYMKKFVFATMLAFFWACNTDDDKTEDPVFCTLEARAGIEIIVKDAVEGTILTEGVEVILTDGEYTETLTSFSKETSFYGAYERVGTYTITVNKNEYKTSVTNSVTVEKDICHVITEKIEVFLEKNQ